MVLLQFSFSKLYVIGTYKNKKIKGESIPIRHPLVNTPQVHTYVWPYWDTLLISVFIFVALNSLLNVLLLHSSYDRMEIIYHVFVYRIMIEKKSLCIRMSSRRNENNIMTACICPACPIHISSHGYIVFVFVFFSCTRIRPAGHRRYHLLAFCARRLVLLFVSPTG